MGLEGGACSALPNTSEGLDEVEIKVLVADLNFSALTATSSVTLETPDHVEPHGGDPNMFFLGQLQSSCKPCHDSRRRFLEINGYAAAVGLDGWPLDPLHPANRVR